jgi:hypothetical protein
MTWPSTYASSGSATMRTRAGHSGFSSLRQQSAPLPRRDRSRHLPAARRAVDQTDQRVERGLPKFSRRRLGSSGSPTNRSWVAWSMIASHAASPTTSPLCSRRPAILAETSIRRSVDPTHLPPPDRLDAAIVEVEGDAANTLAAQHSWQPP